MTAAVTIDMIGEVSGLGLVFRRRIHQFTVLGPTENNTNNNTKE
jgi:hypothetical protein